MGKPEHDKDEHDKDDTRDLDKPSDGADDFAIDERKGKPIRGPENIDVKDHDLTRGDDDVSTEGDVTRDEEE